MRFAILKAQLLYFLKNHRKCAEILHTENVFKSKSKIINTDFFPFFNEHFYIASAVKT